MSSVRARQPLDSCQGAPARAGAGQESDPIAGAKANEREGAGGEGGQDQFSRFFCRSCFPGGRIDHFGEKVVLTHVEPLASLAFERQGRPGDFAQAVMHPGLHVEFVFQAFLDCEIRRVAHQNDGFQGQFIGIQIGPEDEMHHLRGRRMAGDQAPKSCSPAAA